MSARHVANASLQLDPFDDALSPERQRLSDALACLRESVPTALEVVAWLRYDDTLDTRGPCENGSWAYCVCAAGLRFEMAEAWGPGAMRRGEKWGFRRTPAHLVTWAELTDLIGDDPRRSEVAAWAESLPLPRWRQLQRPHEMGPDPDCWHPDDIRSDHEDPHWTGRLRAWQLVIEILNDAIDRVTTVELNP
jgi:hypothetical protein